MKYYTIDYRSCSKYWLVEQHTSHRVVKWGYGSSDRPMEVGSRKTRIAYALLISDKKLIDKHYVETTGAIKEADIEYRWPYE